MSGARNFSPTREEYRGTFSGGINSNSDVLGKKNPAQLSTAINMIVSKPVGYLNSSALSTMVATTVPPTAKIGTNFYEYFSYGVPFYQQTIATFENTDWPTETWAFSGTGTASLVAAITEGDQALSCACAAGQTAVGTGTVTSINLNSPTPAYSIFGVDVNTTGVSNFASGFIRIGSSSSNYRQYTLPTPPSGNGILKFNFNSPDSTTGTPDLTAITYVQVSVTATGGGAMTMLFDNLRLGSFTNTTVQSPGLLTANAVNVYTASVFDTVVGTTSKIVYQSGDGVFLSQSVADSGSTLTAVAFKAGFKNCVSGVLSSNLYMTQFPKTGAVNNNIIYYVNGSDGYFSYDPAASAGSRNARISSTAHKYICSHKNMTFLSGDPANPDTVQPSDVNDPTSLTSANAVVVPTTAGSYITGLVSMDEYLAILRSDGIYKLYGSNPASASTDFNLIRSLSNVGCIEQKAACRVGNALYFFNGNGIYVFNGETSTLISEGMENLLDGYNTKLCSMYYNPIRECVVFQYSPSTVPDPVTTPANHYELYYYPKLNSWGHSGGISDVSSVKFFGIGWGGSLYSKPLVYEGGLQFYQLDPTTNTAYSMAWSATTQWNDCGTPLEVKDFASLSIWVRDFSSASLPSVTVTVYTDYDFSTAKLTISNVVPTNNVIELGLNGVGGKAVAFKIAGTCTDQAAHAVILSGYRGMFTYTVAP